jgi:hypothetical protein
MNQALELNRAFNVGDKVISLRYLHLWDSSFYHVRFLNDSVHVVTSVNDKFFTFTPNLELPDKFSLDSYAGHNAYYQVSGECFASPDKMVFSFERDGEIIQSKLDEVFKSSMKKMDDDFKNAVIETPKTSDDVHRYIQERDTHNRNYFAKKKFLFERFQEIVNHIFAKQLIA